VRDDRTTSEALPSWSELQALGRGAGVETIYRNLFEGFIGGIPVGVVVIDSQSGAMIHANEAMGRILDAGLDGIIGTHYLDHVAPEDRERIGDYHRRRLLGDPTLPDRYEMLLSTRKGARRVVDFQVAPVRFSDAIMVLLRDVTEEKLYHEPLVHMQKMAGMSDLVGRIAHEFNNLLASVLGHTSLLRRRIGDDGDLDVLVCRVEQATQKAREVMGQLLELGGGGGSFFDRISGAALVERLEQLVRRPPGAKGAEVILDISEVPWPVRGDLNLLTQAILELIANAADAAGESGRIRVRLENLDLAERTDAPAAAPPGEVLAISVEDDGPGIPLELRARVVEPYFTTRGEARHDGLGLTQVFNTAQEFDGVLEIGDAAGGGARVTLYLPRGPDPDANLPALLETCPQNGAEPKVLVVDDQEYIGEMIEQMLETRQVAVCSMSDPAAALAAIESGSVDPDLLIVDAKMPGMDGRDLALRVRAIRPDLPIVMTSGYTGTTAMDDRAAKVLSGFLKKPFTVDTLFEMVLPLLGRDP
jgi:two-component system, cell cycle sensor histidine kinase and response regulator CckA